MQLLRNELTADWCSMPKARIVVVEDEPAIRRGVSDALRLSGYEVTEAPDGVAGLHEAAAAGVDLVLLDIMLPKRDGLEVLSELRRTNPTRPALFFSPRRGSEDDRVRGLKNGSRRLRRETFLAGQGIDCPG